MNILQSLKLGHKLTMIHKKSSAVFSIFFGLLFSSVVLLSNAINNEYTQISSAFKDATNGKYLAKVSICHGSYINNSCEQPNVYDDMALKIAKKYRGDLIGAVITYVSDNKETIYVIPDKATKILNAEPAYYAGENEVPIITSENSSSDVKNGFYKLGTYPGDETDKYYVLDDSGKLTNYIAINGYVVDNYAPLLVFDTFEDLLNAKKANDNITEIFTKQIEEKNKYEEKLQTAKKLFMGLFILVVITIAIMLIIIFRNDKKIISLYRSLGATKRNIAAIYLVDVIEIVIYISIIALIVGNVVSAIILR